MFTGIIVELGVVKAITYSATGGTLEVSSPQHHKDISLGDSIAVNGVCLTATSLTATGFTADLSKATFESSALKSIRSNDKVNIELAMAANGRFGGHIVQGHVDDVGKVISSNKSGNSWNISIAIKRELHKYIVEKGSITVNGISLTVSSLTADGIIITVIPHTYENSSLQFAKPGSLLNIEVDILAKYVEKLLPGKGNSNIDASFLAKHGFHK